MASFAVLIDDGEYIASEARATYPNMFMAMADTLRTAALIATEVPRLASGEQRMVCEVRDNRTGERRELIVRLNVELSTMVPDLQ